MTDTVGLGAGHRVDRWERQQERYAIDREARFTAMVDVIEHAARWVPHPLVVDLGCGPGSLAHRSVQGPLPDIEPADLDAWRRAYTLVSETMMEGASANPFSGVQRS